jgi:hypothetical protein
MESKISKIGSRGLNETAETNPVVSLRPRNPNFANDCLECLGEYEATLETALACESGPKGELFDEKPRVENLMTLSL